VSSIGSELLVGKATGGREESCSSRMSFIRQGLAGVSKFTDLPHPGPGDICRLVNAMRLDQYSEEASSQGGGGLGSLREFGDGFLCNIRDNEVLAVFYLPWWAARGRDANISLLCLV